MDGPPFFPKAMDTCAYVLSPSAREQAQKKNKQSMLPVHKNRKGWFS